MSLNHGKHNDLSIRVKRDNLNSYNCFHSVLSEVLNLFLGKKSILLINNRWQFFYNEFFQNYSDDHRVLGEHPLLYDKVHLHMLASDLSIKVEVHRLSCGVDELRDYVIRDGYAITFADMYILNKSTIKEHGKCVTTIVITEINDLLVRFTTYDSQKKDNCIDIKTLVNAWENASEHRFLNRSVVTLSCEKLPSNERIARFFINCIQYSVNTYLCPSQNGFFLQGKQGMYKFADDMLENKFHDQSVLVDCASYMEFAIRQRVCLLNTVKQFNISIEQVDLMGNMSQIINKWKNVQLFIFVAAKREQFNALKYIGIKLHEIAEDEVALLNIIRSINEENVKSIQKE